MLILTLEADTIVNDRFLTPNEIADILRVKYRTVLDMINMGQLPACQIGRQYRILESEFNRFISESKVQGFYCKINQLNSK
jgi:excisionase family DNA binding protein